MHANIEVIEYGQNRGRGRPPKDSQPTLISHIQAEIVLKETAITITTEQAGRFLLDTNVLDPDKLSNEDVLPEYKAQQSTERGFRFLKDPLFFYFHCVSKLKKKSGGFGNGYGFMFNSLQPRSEGITPISKTRLPNNSKSVR